MNQCQLCEIRAYLCAVRPPQAFSRSASDSLKTEKQNKDN